MPLVLTKANFNAISLTLVLEHKVQGYHLGRWSGGGVKGVKNHFCLTWVTVGGLNSPEFTEKSSRRYHSDNGRYFCGIH